MVMVLGSTSMAFGLLVSTGSSVVLLLQLLQRFVSSVLVLLTLTFF